MNGENWLLNKDGLLKFLNLLRQNDTLITEAFHTVLVYDCIRTWLYVYTAYIKDTIYHVMHICIIYHLIKMSTKNIRNIYCVLFLK